MNFSNTISTRVSTQLPQFITQNYPNFVAFLETYYQYLEDATAGNTIYQIYQVLNNLQIDTANDYFLQFFQNDFLPYFPQNTALDIRKLLKAATSFYQTKGSKQSLQFLLRVLYGLDSEIYYPKQNILKLSDGKWQLPQVIKLIANTVTNFNVAILTGRQGVGSESGTTCSIENATLAIDPTLNIEIIEIFISNILKPFTPGESLIVNCGPDANGNPIIFEEPIIGSLASITIDPNNRGLLYVGTKLYANGTISYPGDPVSIIGGTANSASVIEAQAFVGNVTQGSVTSVTPLAGGYGYSVYPNTILTFIDAPGDTGSGANAVVDGIKNTVNLLINTDSIQFKQNVNIGDANYNFSNTTNANVNTLLGSAFTYANIIIGSISHITLETGGFGYTEVPTINVASYVDTDYSASLYAAYLASPSLATFNTWIANRGWVKDLGRIAAIQILNGGRGYSNVTDQIYLNTEIGYGLTTNFITDANGSITSVLITNSGAGFQTPKPAVFVANSANSQNASAGSGAALIAYGDNSGEDLAVSVSSIGQIQDLRITNRGFDYISTPLVSLRNEDITIQPITTNQFFFQTEPVFQGANINTASFIAYVDSYDRPNNILRVYNYVGALNVTQNLVSANFNTFPISVNVYGNGKARANASFLGGVINFPGYWLNTDGFLSSDKYFEDDKIYHNYSYIVKIEKALSAYQDTLQKIIHPAGMVMLGIETITDFHSETLVEEDFLPIGVTNTTIYTGTVTVNVSSNVARGFGTPSNWGLPNNGSLLVLSTGGRQQVKEILSYTATTLNLEANTTAWANDLISTTNGSNLVVTTSGTTWLATGDVITLNVSGNTITANVLNVDIGTGRVNVNVTFAVNTTNNYYMVFPQYNNVSYTILNNAQYPEA